MPDLPEVPVPDGEPTDAASSRGTRARWWVVAVGVVGLALVAVGARMVSEPHVFGWFSYSPLTDVHFSPSITSYFWRGTVCVAAGALLLGGVGGYWLGRRAATKG